MNNQRLTQTQRQELKLSPQQIQLMKLLQLPLIELEQRIKEEIEANPALEEDARDDYDDNEPIADDSDNGENDDYNDEETDFSKDDEFDINDYLPEEDLEDYSYKLQANNYSSDDDPYEAPIVNEETFQDYLMQQLTYRDLTEKQLEIGEYIIGNLGDNGYLSRPVPNIVDDMLFTMNVTTTEEEVTEVLKIVQELDPPGIAARNLQECLLIQLQRRQEENPYADYSLSIRIIKDCFEEFTRKHYDKIGKKLEVSNRELKPALDEILKDVADKVGLDISTISRVANSKYVQTPYGTFLLKFFFSEGITNEEGEEVSTREIKKILRDCVDNEDKSNPMTDEQLMLVLKDKGYPIARRTVAKYREQLGIPVGRMRKKI